MQTFTIHDGLVVPLDRENVDTDAIIPKQFLKTTHRTGFGDNLFDEWRFLDPGLPGKPIQQREPNPDFVLNQARYQGASILLARRNFGCGSSREHAPWALAQYGFRAVLAPSFADIFHTNCLKNGLLPIVLSEASIQELFDEVAARPGYKLRVDLCQQVVTTPTGREFLFSVGPFARECLLAGLDEIGWTLLKRPAIAEFERSRLQRQPWLELSLPGAKGRNR